MSTCHTLQWARRGAVWLAGWLCVAAAGAAEITLYEHENFGGAQLTLRGYTPNIGSTGFNDRASSLVVRSGRWELCSDNDFRGTCAIFERGEYRTVGSNLNDRISSAREVGSNPDNRGSYSNYGRGAIALFENEGFGGQSVQLEGDTAALASAGFNDRAESVIVRSGTWQLCANNNFGGTCRTFPPGRYPELGQLARQFSSARLVRSANDAPAVIRPGDGGPPPRPAEGPRGGGLDLFSEPGFGGERLSVDRTASRLDRWNFNDRAASAIVYSGQWEFCTDNDFRGSGSVFGPGRYERLGGLTRQLSSARRLQ